jgi:hypothetical protein
MLGIGDEVICVDDSKPEGWSSLLFPQWVQKDNKYIIREILDNDDIVVGILLVELKNPQIWQDLLGRYQEGAFATWRFEKLRSAYEIEEEEKYNEVVKELELENQELKTLESLK